MMKPPKRDLRPDLHRLLMDALTVTEKLKIYASRFGLQREFSLDGRLLGDVGELLTHCYFNVCLHEHQRTGHDAVVHSSSKVEIKLRSKSKQIELNEKPEFLLVLYLCPKSLKWDVVFNGPGERLPDGHKTKKYKYVITLDELANANSDVLRSERIPTKVRLPDPSR